MKRARTKKPHVGIIVGSTSDLEVMSGSAVVLEEFDIPFEVTVVSAHRTPLRMVDYAKHGAARGLRVIIAGAGGSAHLPGMVASLTTLPVIGVPIKSSNSIDGLDSLLSIVQMPPGVPVATVAINGAKNAGLLAAEIIGSWDVRVSERLSRYKEQMRSKVERAARKLEKAGYQKFLRQK
jgi:5-(carboxyamino)imidazole ribonucleotide mutase